MHESLPAHYPLNPFPSFIPTHLSIQQMEVLIHAGTIDRRLVQCHFIPVELLNIRLLDQVSCCLLYTSSLWDDLLISKTAGTVDYIFCTNSGSSLGVLSSVLSAGRNEIGIFGIDDEDGQISALQDPSNPYLATVGRCV